MTPDKEMTEALIKLGYALASQGCTGDVTVTLSRSDFRRLFWPWTYSAHGPQEVSPSAMVTTLEEYTTTEVKVAGPCGWITIKAVDDGD